MESFVQRNEISAGSVIAAVLVLAIAGVFLFRWTQGVRADLAHLIIAGGFLLCAPYAYFNPGWARLTSGARRKPPVWTTIGLAAGLVAVVAAFVIAQV